VREYAARVVGSDDAEDVAQETMLRALCRSGGIDLTGSPRPWLYFVARNVGIDQHRRRRPVPLDGDVLATMVPPAPDDAVAAVVRSDVVRVLGQAMRRLCRRDREVLVAHEVEGLAIPEIARRDGVTPNAIRQRLFRARHNLGRVYESLGGARYGLLPPVAVKARRSVAGAARALTTRAETGFSTLGIGTGTADRVAAAVAAVSVAAVVAAGAGAGQADPGTDHEPPPSHSTSLPEALTDPIDETIGPGGTYVLGRRLHVRRPAEVTAHVDVRPVVQKVGDVVEGDPPALPPPGCTAGPLRCAVLHRAALADTAPAAWRHVAAVRDEGADRTRAVTPPAAVPKDPSLG
jgi:RNA polymerase sigma-70 factor (ECF subfamily)